MTTFGTTERFHIYAMKGDRLMSTVTDYAGCGLLMSKYNRTFTRFYIRELAAWR